MNVDEIVVAAGKDTAFELYLTSGDEYNVNLLDFEVDTDPKKV